MIAMERRSAGLDALEAQRRTVALRIVNGLDEIEMVELVIVAIGADVDEVSLHGRTLGYVQRVGHVFVALTGERYDRAEECGQFLLWDHAASRLLDINHALA